MKKVALYSLLSIIVIAVLLFNSCGGGGGGAASASLPDSEYTTHNHGGWGGGGSSGGGSSGGSSGGTSEVEIQGGTSLIVTGYTFNGTTYPDLTALTLAMSAAGASGSFTVPFTVSGESTPRTARVTKTNEGYRVEHQYRAEYEVTISGGGFDSRELYYYANDGFDITADTNSNVEGWQDSNGGYHSGGVIRGVSGDITLVEVFKGTDFTISLTEPNSATVVTGTYKLANTTDGFSFTATPSIPSESFPSGATYTWTINNGTPVSGTNPIISISPDNFGTISRRRASATPVNIKCVVTKPGIATKSSETNIMVYMPYNLPSFVLRNGAGTTWTDNSYCRYVSMTQDTLSFNVHDVSAMPAGTEYEWYRNNGNGDIRITGKSGASVGLTAADLGFTAANPIPTTEAAAVDVTIKCTAKNPDAEDSSTNQTFIEKTVTVKVWKLTIPDVSLSIISTPSGAIQATNSNGNSVYMLPSLTGTFQIIANLDDNSFSGAQYYWHIAKVGGNSFDTSTGTNQMLSINLENAALAAALGITESDLSTNVNNPDVINVTCTVKHADMMDDIYQNEWKSANQTVRICKKTPYSISLDTTSIGINESATITIIGSTDTPTFNPAASQYLTFGAPQQDASDPTRYTVNVTVKDGSGGLGKVWFDDDTPVSINATAGGETSNTVSLTLNNTYKFQLYNSNGTPIGPLSTMAQLYFAQAKSAVGVDPSTRAVVAFKNEAGNIVLTEAENPGPTSITFNSTNFSNREISLTAVPVFSYTVKDGNDGTLSQAGTQADPYVLKFDGTPAEKSLHVSVPTGEFYGEIGTSVDPTGVLSRSLGSTPYNNPGIGIMNTLTADAIPTDPVKVTLKDSGTGATQDFYVKVQAPASAPEGFVSVEGNGSTIPNLYVCDHEVTQGEYETYCGYGGTAPSNQYGLGTNYPAYYVTWYDALVYCNLRSRAEGLQEYYTINGSTDPSDWPDKGTGSNGKLCGPSSSNGAWDSVSVNTSANGYRLPTAAEWEWTANGGTHHDTYTYAGSDDIGAVAWYSENSGDNEGPSSNNGKTHEIKGKAPNTLGIYDMSGNVWEWCWDTSSSDRVYRGGSWNDDASNCAVSNWYEFYPHYRNSIFGFRVVRNAP